MGKEDTNLTLRRDNIKNNVSLMTQHCPVHCFLTNPFPPIVIIVEIDTLKTKSSPLKIFKILD